MRSTIKTPHIDTNKMFEDMKLKVQSKLREFIQKKKLEIDKVAKDDFENRLLQSYLGSELKALLNIKG